MGESQGAWYKWKFRPLLALCFFGGLALTLLSTRLSAFLPTSLHPATSKLLEEIGKAITIAPILAFLIEIKATKEMLSSFVKDVSHHIIGHRLPPALREHMLKILTLSFVRKRWEVTHTLDVSSCRPGFVRLTSRSVSEIENVSLAPELFTCPFEFGTKRECDRALPILRRAKATVGDDVMFEETFVSGRKSLGNSVARTPDGGHQRFERKVPVASGATVKEEFELIECYPDDYGAPYFSLWPVLEVVVKVLYPKDKFNVELYVSYIEHERAIKSDLTDGTEWTINVPMLPGQSFSVEWQRIVPEGTRDRCSQEEEIIADIAKQLSS
jgi:hypothetical protein